MNPAAPRGTDIRLHAAGTRLHAVKSENVSPLAAAFGQRPPAPSRALGPEPLDYPTEDGRRLVRERNESLAAFSFAMVMLVAALSLGFVAGMFVQQFIIDARGHHYQQRV